MKTNRAIERRHRFKPHGPACGIEYPLPCQAMPTRVQRRLDRWLAECVGCGPDDVSARLEERWSDLPRLGMGTVAKHFLNCTPHSILVSPHWAWLVVRDRPNEGFEAGREWFLPPP